MIWIRRSESLCYLEAYDPDATRWMVWKTGWSPPAPSIFEGPILIVHATGTELSLIKDFILSRSTK